MKVKKSALLAGIGILGILCLGGCTEKRNIVENTNIQKEQEEKENTFEGLKDNMVFDVLWKDKEETWFAGNASCVYYGGIEVTHFANSISFVF